MGPIAHATATIRELDLLEVIEDQRRGRAGAPPGAKRARQNDALDTWLGGKEGIRHIGGDTSTRPSALTMKATGMAGSLFLTNYSQVNRRDSARPIRKEGPISMAGSGIEDTTGVRAPSGLRINLPRNERPTEANRQRLGWRRSRELGNGVRDWGVHWWGVPRGPKAVMLPAADPFSSVVITDPEPRAKGGGVGRSNQSLHRPPPPPAPWPPREPGTGRAGVSLLEPQRRSRLDLGVHPGIDQRLAAC